MVGDLLQEDEALEPLDAGLARERDFRHSSRRKRAQDAVTADGCWAGTRHDEVIVAGRAVAAPAGGLTPGGLALGRCLCRKQRASPPSRASAEPFRTATSR